MQVDLATRKCRTCGDSYETALPPEVFTADPAKDQCWGCTTRRIEAERDGHDHAGWRKCAPDCPRFVKGADRRAS